MFGLDTDHLLRGLLTFFAFASLLLAGGFFGSIAPERSWPIRVICLGLFGVMAYVTAGQFKAFNLEIPFDSVSWIGLISYSILLTGLAWFAVREQRTRRDR